MFHCKTVSKFLSMSTPFQNIYNRCTFSSSQERPSEIQTISLSEQEKIELNDSSQDLDIDFFLVAEKCEILLNKAEVVEMFGRKECAVLNSPFYQSLYSKVAQNVLVFGKLSEYFVGIPVVSNLSNTDEDEEPEAETDFFEQSLNLLKSKIEKALSTGVILQNFQQFCDFLLLHFHDNEVVIFKFGQKIQLRLLNAYIVSLVHDAKLKVELAIGKQVSKDGKFICAELEIEFQKFCYSNFYSSKCCNLLLSDEGLCARYSPKCFRLCLYNTLQHFKREIKICLGKETLSVDELADDSPEEEFTLESTTQQVGEDSGDVGLGVGFFMNSFVKLQNSLKLLTPIVANTQLRFELYFTVSSLCDFEDAKVLVKTLLPTFKLCSQSSRMVKNQYIQKRIDLKDLFNSLKSKEDASVFMFLKYFWTYSSFLHSDKRLTRSFVDSNHGLLLDEAWFSPENGLPTEKFLESFTLNFIYNSLKQTFGHKKRYIPIVSFYFQVFCLHFQRKIIGRPRYLQISVEKLKSFFFFRSNSILASDHPTKPIVNVSASEFMALLSAKCHRDPFSVKIIQQFQCEMSRNGVFIQEFISTLYNCGLNINQRGRIITLCSKQNSVNEFVPWVEVLSFINQFSLTDYTDWSERGASLHPSHLQNLAFCDFVFRIFRVRMLPRVKEAFSNSTFTPACFRFPIEASVFFRIFFLSYPSDPSGAHDSLKKAANNFLTFLAFSKFIFAVMFKYYCGSTKAPSALNKYFYNALHAQRRVQETSNERATNYTFMKIIYFTGLFDRSGHQSGIFLPLPRTMRLVSRIGKHPHHQLTSGLRFALEEQRTTFRATYTRHEEAESFHSLTDSELEVETESSPLVAEQLLEIPMEIDNPEFLQSANDMSELQNPIVFASNSLVFEDEAPLSVEMGPCEAEVNPEALSVFNFKEQLLQILDNAGKVELVDKMVFEGVDEALLKESSVAELEHFFVDDCNMSKITARTVATKFKRHFQ